MRKVIYLIRHGESEGNLNNTVQTIETPLSETGIKQAHLAKSKIINLKIDSYLTSNMQRAKQTGKIIFFDKLNGDISKIQESELFREFSMPTSIHGLPADSDEYKRVVRAWEDNLEDEDYKFEDEESDREFKNRLRQALNFLETLPAENIAVVAHGYFIRSLLAFILLNGEANMVENTKVADRFATANTGFTKIIFDDSKNNKWKISTFNDHSHLVENIIDNQGS